MTGIYKDDDIIISPHLSTQCKCVVCYTCTFVLITQWKRFGARFLLAEKYACVFCFAIFLVEIQTFEARIELNEKNS